LPELAKMTAAELAEVEKVVAAGDHRWVEEEAGVAGLTG
jgi:hypothetical protein